MDNFGELVAHGGNVALEFLFRDRHDILGGPSLGKGEIDLGIEGGGVFLDEVGEGVDL